MRLKADQLSNHLKQQFSPVYLVTGDEPLLVHEAVDQIRAQARKEGYDERQVLYVEKGFDWQTLIEGAGALSLFASKRIIELKLPNGKPGTEGAKALAEFASRPPEDTILIIESGKIDKRSLESKWAKALDKSGVIVQVWPVPPENMPRFMAQRAKSLGLKIDRDALNTLSSRLEGNLLAAKQELDKLALLYNDKTISLGMVLDEVKDSARYDAFHFVQLVLERKARDALNVLAHLKAEGTEPTLILWALSRDVRIVSELIQLQGNNGKIQACLKKNRVFSMQQDRYLNSARNLKLTQTYAAIAQCKQADDSIKGLNKFQSPWPHIEHAALCMCGIEQPTQLPT